MDRVGGTMKNVVLSDKKSGKYMMNIPKPFVKYADEKIIAVTTFYMSKKEVKQSRISNDCSKCPRNSSNLQNHPLYQQGKSFMQ